MKNILEDESSLLQFGQYTEETFYTFSIGMPQPSAWNTFPTPENPGAKFKYVGIDIWLSPNLKLWTRETYAILDYLGDLGGLYDALYILLNIVAAPIATYRFQSSLLSDSFEIAQSHDQSKLTDKVQKTNGHYCN